MGGRGASSGGGFIGKNSTVNPANIVNPTSLISAREGKQTEVDEVLQTSKDILEDFGYVANDMEIASFKGKDASTLACFGGDNLIVNRAYFNKARMESAYADCVKSGFHPSQGNKTALQAVTAHELGHGLTDVVGKKMGAKGDSATAILNEAKKSIGYKGSIGNMASKISGYAQYNPRETIAEAFSDVYCNGTKAHRESQAIVNVMKKYTKSGGN